LSKIKSQRVQNSSVAIYVFLYKGSIRSTGQVMHVFTEVLHSQEIRLLCNTKPWGGI